MNPWQWFRARSSILQAGIVLVGLVGLALAYWLVSPIFIVVAGSEAPPPDHETVRSGMFEGRDGHHASGTALVLRSAGGEYTVRLNDDFQVTNGPDIHVWLSTSEDVYGEAIDLGAVRFTQGSSNYAIPDGVDAAQYRYVIIWCNPFGVLFGTAELSPA